MIEKADRSSIIDHIYDVAVDPVRYEAMLDVWEKRLSKMRLTADRRSETGPIVSDEDIETHLRRAEVFLQRLHDNETGDDRSAIDLETKAAFIVNAQLRIEQANQIAKSAFGVNPGDEVASLPLHPDDTANLRATLRAMLRNPAAESALMRFQSPAHDRSIILYVSRAEHASILVRSTELVWPKHLSQTMRDAFSLTAAEVEIVRALAEGSSLKTVAEARSRSLETVRSQVAAILTKTETHSQAELIRLTLGLMNVVVGAADQDNVSASPSLDPIPFETMWMPDGRRYDFIEFGDPDGRALLYLPMDYGLIRWPKRAELAARENGIRVIVPVRAGYGMSSQLPKGVDYTRATASDLLKLLDHLDVAQCAVLSLGADLRFAIALSVAAPHRVKGIYGCSGALPVMTAEQYERMHKWHRFILANARYAPQILPFLVKAGFALARRIGKERFFRSVNAGSPADMRTFADPETREAILTGAEVCLSARHSAFEAFSRECIDSETNWTELVHACKVPVRLLQGAEDPQTPKETVLELIQEFSHLDVEIVEDGGQLTFFQYWPRVLAELERMLPKYASRAAA